jgi:hypothetical protein
MSVGIKRIFLCLIGVIAGIASWPLAELALQMQGLFPSYLIFSIFLGVLFGIVIGGFFCSTEGIVQNDRSKMIIGIITGAIIGLIGGIIGFLIGQGVLFILGQSLIHSTKNFNLIGQPLSRSVGWAILGIFIGVTEGVRSMSFKKIRIGILGGLIGGVVGGLALEYIRFVISNMMIARLIGLIIFGFFIGLFYGFIEKGLSYGILRLLNGIYKGKEYLINQRKIKIGAGKSNDIVLGDYEDIDKNHAVIYVKKKDLYIKRISKKYPVYVNDEQISEYRLKLEDVIKIGQAKFFYKYK